MELLPGVRALAATCLLEGGLVLCVLSTASLGHGSSSAGLPEALLWSANLIVGFRQPVGEKQSGSAKLAFCEV